MPRPKHCRKIEYQPEVVYFKPQGVPAASLEVIKLENEELEALRLKNVVGLDQVQAAKKMGTSQSTFQRILTSAYRKVSEALVDGKAVKITNARPQMREFECWKCKNTWQEPFGNGKRGVDMNCPACTSHEIHRTDHHGHGRGKQKWGYKPDLHQDNQEE